MGVNLKQGYNGDITAREAGSVGGQMVNTMTPIRTMRYERASRTATGYSKTIEYAATISA